MRPIIDAHLDLSWNALQWNRDLTRPLAESRQLDSRMKDHPSRGRGTVTLPELVRADVRACLATILVRSKPEVCPPTGFNRRDLDFCRQSHAYAVGQGQLAYYLYLEEQGTIRILRTSEDLRSHWQREESSPLGVILAMEGADPIVTPDQAEQWWNQGLRCVGLAHYGPASYAVGTGTTGSLTPAGHELLKEFARLGIIIDLTHCSLPGFQEVIDSYPGAVHASHNMCQALVPGDRQFADWQIQALIERDAVIGMAFDAWMLVPDWHKDLPPGSVTLEIVADHIDHICQLAGNVRHVGIGSDLDGGFGTEQTPEDLDSIADLQQLDEILSRRGYAEADIDAIFHKNWLRFFEAALP